MAGRTSRLLSAAPAIARGELRHALLPFPIFHSSVCLLFDFSCICPASSSRTTNSSFSLVLSCKREKKADAILLFAQSPKARPPHVHLLQLGSIYLPSPFPLLPSILLVLLATTALAPVIAAWTWHLDWPHVKSVFLLKSISSSASGRPPSHPLSRLFGYSINTPFQPFTQTQSLPDSPCSIA